MHRKRNLALALLILAFLAAALALFYATAARSFRTDPRPARDLLAELNAPLLTIPDTDRAAPIYQTLHDAWQALPPPQHPDPYFDLRQLTPADPACSAFAQALAAVDPQLTAARAAAARPALGAEFVRSDPDAEPTQFAPYDQVMAESAYALRIPGLSAASIAANLLLIDADTAAANADPARTAANLHAALAIARQVREVPMFLADYIAIATVRTVGGRIRRILAHHPDLLPPEALASLQTDLTDTARQTAIRFENERLGLPDLLDRTFTPGPRGRITAVGLRRLDRMSTHLGPRRRIPDESSPLAPLQAWTIGTRVAHLEIFERQLAAAVEAQQGGFRALSDLHRAENELMFSPDTERRLPLAIVAIPAYAHAIHNEHAMRFEVIATSVVLALHRHHADHAAFPIALTSLVPDYLDAVPTDPFDLDAGPIKYIRTTDTFTLYANGSNFKDDHAAPMPPDPQRQHGSIDRFGTDENGVPYPDTHHADWILYPPQP